MRKWDIYRHQELGKWKDKFAPEIARSAVSNGGQATELNRRIVPEKNRGTSATSFGGFVTVDKTADLDPRNIFQSGLIRRFRTAARPPNVTAVSPKMVKPRRSQRHLHRRSSRKTKHTNVHARTFPNNLRETNYSTLKAKMHEVQVWVLNAS